MDNLLSKNLKRHIILDKGEFNILFKSMKRKEVSRKEFLIQSGDVAKNTYFITKGLLRLYQIKENGIEKTALFAKEEWWVSDLYSFYSQKPAIHFLQAMEKSEVLVLSKHKLEELFHQIPKLERFFRIIQQNAFISQNERIMDMLTKSAELRYLKFIEKYPKAELRIPQKEIASYLGLTPEFLSKMKKKIKS
jgi:CRP-like cAMP-binding protein